MKKCLNHNNCFWREVSETLCFSDACGAYHALSPLLHQLGIFSSYNGYTELISQLIEQQYEACSRWPNTLVVGFASKDSVRALLEIPATKNLEITFLDRCPTPVNQARKEFNSHANLHFLNANIFEYAPMSRYDLILTDSLLRQFQIGEKREILHRLARLLNTSGKAVFREYVGTNNCDLKSFLASIDNTPSLLAWKTNANDKCKMLFNRLLPSLKEYMGNVGGSYISWELLVSDITNAHLAIDKTSVFCDKFGIIVCDKTNAEIDCE